MGTEMGLADMAGNDITDIIPPWAVDPISPDVDDPMAVGPQALPDEQAPYLLPSAVLSSAECPPHFANVQLPIARFELKHCLSITDYSP